MVSNTISAKNSVRIPLSACKFVYNKADLNKISHFMSIVDWVNLFENSTVQEMYDELINYVSKASNLFIPVSNVSILKNSPAPWIKEDLKNLIRKKKNLRYMNLARKWKDIDLCKDYRPICKMVTSETKRPRLVNERNLVEKAKQNPKLLYKYLNSQQAVKESIKALKKSNGELTQDPKEIANLLNKCFQEVFVTEQDGDTPPFEVKLSEKHSRFIDFDLVLGDRSRK